MAALAIAAKKGLLEVIGELVLAGGQLDEQDEEQMSPLMWAARNGHTSMVQRAVVGFSCVWRGFGVKFGWCGP